MIEVSNINYTPIGAMYKRRGTTIREPILKLLNITFTLKNLNRVESMVLCENSDSYVQQSQRYVTVDKNNYEIDLSDIPDDEETKGDLQKMIGRTFELYERMTELTDEAKLNKKGRPSPSDYKHGIPIEDARYILPLCTKTSIQVTMTMDKMPRLINSLFKEGLMDLYGVILSIITDCYGRDIANTIIRFSLNSGDPYTNPIDFIEELLDNIPTDSNNVIILDIPSNLDKNVALGALTSSSQDVADDIEPDKAEGVIKRVCGYGHTSIMEQARYTVGLCMSLTCAHQFIRHRIHNLVRESFSDIMLDVTRGYITPKSIENSEFMGEYNDIICKITSHRYRLIHKYGYHPSYNAMLLNCEKIKYIENTNARADEWVMKERTCNTAAWEIRDLSKRKLKLLKEHSNVLFENAMPPCVNGVCKEGKLCCGKADEVREYFGKSGCSTL